MCTREAFMIPSAFSTEVDCGMKAGVCTSRSTLNSPLSSRLSSRSFLWTTPSGLSTSFSRATTMRE